MRSEHNIFHPFFGRKRLALSQFDPKKTEKNQGGLGHLPTCFTLLGELLNQVLE
jgi:hypothetical protein